MAELAPVSGGPFAQALGPQFETLPPALRAFHSVEGVRRFSGEAEIEVATGIVAMMVLSVAGFPRRSGAVPLEIEVEAKGGREVWRRDFGGAETVSNLRFRDGYAFESFGPVTVRLNLRIEEESVLVGVDRAWLFRVLPLPRPLTPVSTSVERTDDQGRFCFDIRVEFPGVGQLIAYRGHIE